MNKDILSTIIVIQKLYRRIAKQMIMYPYNKMLGRYLKKLSL